MLSFEHADFGSVSSREWIVTNGIGGYASSSICGANTRRYHGILVAAFNPPTDRRVIVSRIEEKIRIDGEEYFISSNQYPGVIHPEGYKFLKSFQRVPFPCSVYADEKFSISKTVFMLYGTNTTVIEYENTGLLKFDFDLTPLLVYRDYHHLFHDRNEYEFNCQVEGNKKIKITPKSDVPPFLIHYTDGEFIAESNCHHNVEYYREQERGLDFQEDAVSIGRVHCELRPGQKTYLIVSTEDKLPDGTPNSWRTHEELRLRELILEVQNKFLRDLAVSGDQFVVWRLSSRSYTLIAGYHWFTDWGRDTMIAMRGLLIALGKKQIAESVFRTFFHYLDQGMIPNRFPDQGEEPEYNTIDASLWLFVALYEYYLKFEDITFVENNFSSLTKIIEWHYAGTRYHIHVTPEGLLSGGAPNTQLTWMDAKVGDHVVTPRQGCAVEINALWYNVLEIYIFFAEKFSLPVEDLQLKADKTASSFRKYFINTSGYLNDVIIPGKFAENTIRPNQVYAISLPFSPLNPEEAKLVLSNIETHLYTDVGLRSLAPTHPDFKANYTGDQWQRDHAYHQGTVWAYLWGEYALAYLKIHEYSSQAKDYIRYQSTTLQYHFYHEDGLHAISEIFDGGDPSRGKGCIQQAWSIGMTLKALLASE